MKKLVFLTKNKISLKLSCFLFTLLLSLANHAATCTAVASGNWTVAANWSCGHVPTCNDVIVIPNTKTITITTALDLTGGGCSNTTININGILFFSGNTSRLDLVASATINIAAGGGIRTDVNNNSQKITIGNGPAEWDSNTGNLNGPWRITNGSSISTLPIELVSFNAIPNNTGIELNWITASESNNDYFELQRSENGLEFVRLEKIPSKAPNGNSNSNILYAYQDVNPVKGINYYRLKQVDLNFDDTYHHMIYAHYNPADQVIFKIYPNPNKGKFSIDISGIENNHNISILIYDKAGKMLKEYHTQTNNILSNSFVIDMGENQEKGIYVVTISMEGLNYYSKLIID